MLPSRGTRTGFGPCSAREPAPPVAVVEHARIDPEAPRQRAQRNEEGDEQETFHTHSIGQDWSLVQRSVTIVSIVQANQPWSGVELRHLLALQAVAQAGSFGRAADALGYTQSAISQQIATLEAIVGERLIERSRGPGRVALTQAGKLLGRHAEAIVARLNAAHADFTAFRQGEAGVLRVGTYQSVGTRILPALMREFSAAWPHVNVQLTEAANDDNLLHLIERGELDLTFSILPLPDGPFDAVELLRDPYVLVVAADSPLALAGQAPELHDIAALPLIGFRQCRSVEQVEVHLRGRGIEPRIVFRSDDNGTVQGLVAAGVGAALVPALAVNRDDPTTVMLELDGRVPPRVIAVAWHRDRYRSPAARAFVDAAGGICDRLNGQARSGPAPARPAAAV